MFGIENPWDYLQFEEKVKLDHTSFIDIMISSTRVIIEQKSIDKFLTETYLSLRRLENEALRRTIADGSVSPFSPIMVNINQFYGIEINDFAVSVARTALWIAESQMMKQTEDIVAADPDSLSVAHLLR